MTKFNVTVSETNMGGTTYTNCSMKAGESKADMMSRVLNDHRFIWGIEDGVELTATAKVDRS